MLIPVLAENLAGNLCSFHVLYRDLEIFQSQLMLIENNIVAVLGHLGIGYLESHKRAKAQFVNYKWIILH